MGLNARDERMPNRWHFDGALIKYKPSSTALDTADNVTVSFFSPLRMLAV